MRNLNLLMLSLGATLIVASANAQNLIQNGSFETGTYTWDSYGADSLANGSTFISDWTVVDAEIGALDATNVFAITAEDGSISLDLTGYHNHVPYGGVEQTFTTAAGQVYNLQFWIGVQNSSTIYNGPNTITASINGGTPVAFSNTSTGTGEVWTLASENFTATSTSTTLDLVGQYSQGGSYIGLDNVSVQAVPEPKTGLLFLGICLAVGLKYRFKTM